METAFASRHGSTTRVAPLVNTAAFQLMLKGQRK